MMEADSLEGDLDIQVQCLEFISLYVYIGLNGCTRPVGCVVVQYLGH